MSDTSQHIRPSSTPSPPKDVGRRAGWSGETLLTRFERLVASGPERLAVKDDGGAALTRRQLWQEAGRLAGEMSRRGLRPGDVVIECMPNRSQWQTVFLACLRLGAVPATVPLTTDAATLGYLCELVSARGIVAPVRHRSRALGDEIVAAARTAGIDVTVLLLGDDEAQIWEHVRGERPAAPHAPDGMAHLMFTSSTTGKPKAVVHTEGTLGAVNQGFAERFRIGRDEPIFMASPLGHSVGAWHGARLSLFTGAPLLLQQRWDPEHALALIEREKCAFTAAATPFLKDLIEAGPDDRNKFGGMKTFLCGGSPVPPALLDAATACSPETFVSALWGMTEGGVTTNLPGDPAERIANTAGVGLPGLQLRTLDTSGAPTEPGVEGELAMRGPGVFVGYLGQDDLYRESLTEDGFLRTGDLARVGQDRYLKITGRLKDLIIRGGVNISPVPVENALSTNPRVHRVAVIGIPDERLGERICAVITAAGDPPTLSELLDWLRDCEVPQRLWPEHLHVVDDMPQTAVGKIRKADLRERVRRELP